DDAPLRRGQLEDEEHDHAEGEKIGQYLEQQRQAVEEAIAALEAQIEGGEQRRRGRQQVVERDQEIAQVKMRKTRHPPTDENPVRYNL
ncbi:hypothetical protein ACMWP8_28360, partial [Escherichia coli]|uniref:hypothetical protein n=1 Tax=Escherichia coli TaxID=562 RepID=UPI0039DF2CCD